MKLVTGKPTDSQIDLRFAHQLSVVNDPREETGKHEANRGLGVDARSAIVFAVAIRHITPKPAQVEVLVDASEQMVLRDEIAQGANDEEILLPPILRSNHREIPHRQRRIPPVYASTGVRRETGKV